MAESRPLPRFYYFANFMLRNAIFPLLRLRVRVRGLEHVPRSGPLLLVSNHLSFLDPPLVGAFMPRDMVMMAKAEATESRFGAWVVRNYGAFPIRRGEADLAAIRQAIGVLKGGGALYIAPEGTRSRTGQLLEPHEGAALVAYRSGAPLLPLAMSGQEPFPGNLRRLAPTDVDFTLGPPFRLVSPGGRPGREELQAMSEAMMNQIAALLPPTYRGRFSGEREGPFVEPVMVRSGQPVEGG